MKFFSILLFLVASASVSICQQATPSPSPSVTMTPADAYSPPDADTRFKRYLNGVFGPSALARYVVTAGVGTARNKPEEWGGKWEGFGKRLASDAGRGLIRGTVTYGLDEALKLDSHFYRSKNRSTKSRLVNALVSPVTARNRDGKRVVGLPRIVGTYSAAIIASETWYPKRYSYKDGLKSGTISIGAGALFNLVTEFIRK